MSKSNLLSFAWLHRWFRRRLRFYLLLRRWSRRFFSCQGIFLCNWFLVALFSRLWGWFQGGLLNFVCCCCSWSCFHSLFCAANFRDDFRELLLDKLWLVTWFWSTLRQGFGCLLFGWGCRRDNFLHLCRNFARFNVYCSLFFKSLLITADCFVTKNFEISLSLQVRSVYFLFQILLKDILLDRFSNFRFGPLQELIVREVLSLGSIIKKDSVVCLFDWDVIGVVWKLYVTFS